MIFTLQGLAGNIYETTQIDNRTYVLGGDFNISGNRNLTFESGSNLFLTNEQSRLIVANGTELTVNSIASNHADAKIVVTRGGFLKLEGGTFQDLDNQLWKGVEVWGNSEESQWPPNDQGRFFLDENACIKNAGNGILVSKRDDINSEYLEPDYSGGIVYAQNSTFLNNKVAVEFAPYSDYNYSKFSKCDFITDSLILGNSNPECFIKMNGVNPISLAGCMLKNTRGDNEVHYLYRGTGIFSENAGYFIAPLCLDNSNPCTNLRYTTFEHLTRGIYSMNSSSAGTIALHESRFYDNHNGLYLSGFNSLAHVEVVSSKFRNKPYSIWTYGMYLNECSGYHVENNEFYENTTSTPETIGLIVNNSGTDPNEIYRNTFHNLKFATISQNENRNYDPPLHLGGLCYKCNKFIKDESQQEPNRFDFAITYDGQITNTMGIAKNQGTYLSGTSFAPVGNMFQLIPATSHYDFYNEGNPVDYYYHSQTMLPQFRMRPEPANIYGSVTTIPVTAIFTESSCPSTLEGGGSSEDLDNLTEALSKSDSLGDILSTVVDGGSTSLLNFEVESSTPPEAMQLRTELLAESPYLSDTVMKSSVEKEEVLDNAMIRDVLVANPHSAKSDELINMLEYRTVPMPDYMMEQILAGEDTVSEKEVLEAKKAWWDGEIVKSYTRLLNHYKGDSVVAPKTDSLNWLFNYRNTADALFDQVAWLHSQGEYQQAEIVLNAIPSAFTLTPAELAAHEAFLDFYPVSESILTDTTGVYRIDSVTASTLAGIMNNNTGLPGAYARNLLLAAGKISYQEPILLPDTSLKAFKKKKFRGVKEEHKSNALTVFPNPANDYFVVRFDISGKQSGGVIRIYDVMGKPLQTIETKRNQDQIIVSSAGLKSGLYMITLILDNRIRDMVKVSIVK